MTYNIYVVYINKAGCLRDIEVTKNAQKDFSRIRDKDKDKKLAAEIAHALKRFEKEEDELLVIAPIKGRKHKINEIKIFSPKGCRIFYYYKKGSKYYILGIRKKKSNLFNSQYFDKLDRIIDNLNRGE